MPKPKAPKPEKPVAPFAGAWIEITEYLVKCYPSGVAPFAGAWIEIEEEKEAIDAFWGRSLRGSVD